MSIIGVIGQQVAVQVDFALRNRPPIVARGLETAYQNDIVVELADRAVVDVFGLAPTAQVVVIVAFADELRAAFVADDGAQFLLDSDRDIRIMELEAECGRLRKRLEIREKVQEVAE